MNLHSTFQELSEHFNEILKLQIKEVKKVSPTFQELSGYPNYENVLSNIYKFFIEFEHHGLNDLFLQALDDCFEDEVVLMEEAIVHREFFTKKGGRIDLVITDTDNIDEVTQVVIIENKIFHTLENDLDDYWNTFSHIENKVGFVLSLNELPVKKPFYNITHKQWMTKVKGRLGHHLKHANSKYLVYLQDFFNYIDGFYKDTFNMDSLKFLFEHGKKVDDIVNLQKDGFNHIRDLVIAKVQESSNWSYNAKTRPGISIGNKQGNFLIYVSIDTVFTERRFRLESWLYKKETIAKWNDSGFNDDMRKIAAKNGITIEEKAPTKEWVRIASKDYIIQSSNDLIDIDQKIIDSLNFDWTELRQETELIIS